MLKRHIEKVIARSVSKYRAISLLGPRQSGKTTLARSMFPNFTYINLENPDQRLRAEEDPRGLLGKDSGSLILDEIQKAPYLLSYLQEILDSKNDKRKFILTGSDSLLLSDKISQSLAGRTRIFHVLPFYRQELPEGLRPESLNKTLWMGSYPRIFDEQLNPPEWYGDYFQTYVEKDVRNILEVGNLVQFSKLVRLCAGRCGQLTDYSALASEVGITQPTAVKWCGVLATSFVLFFLQPHFRNFNKRMIKSPKVYFYDTGLLCYLLRIRSPEDLIDHPLRGAIFENWVISERIKQCFAAGAESPYFFWRDQHGHEIDLVEDRGTYLGLTEIKLSETFQPSFADQIHWLNQLQKREGGGVIFGGAESFNYQKILVQSWAEV